jgi:predicted ATPase/DNA-binding CsgD family transcriptional regulator
MTELGELISRSRLITLTGAPGCGKTRLATEVAAVHQRVGRGTTVLVDLSAVTDEQEVYERTVAQLADQRTDDTIEDDGQLLVLDGCDSWLEACATTLTAAFRRFSGLRVLTTSREALRHPWEVVFPLAGLPVASGGGTMASLSSPAVRLFLDRARAVNPGFDITEDDIGHITALCVRLDGLPLAIELAAQLARAYTVPEILKQLDKAPLELLTAGWRTAPSRQQSMRAAVGVSYEMLTAEERCLFRALSQAPGGCESDMAAALTAEAGIPHAVPALLASLESKSLITAVHDQRGNSRFHMLRTLRHFAQDRLEAGAEQEKVRNHVVSWFVSMLRGFGASGALDAVSARRLVRDRTNLAYALEWMRSHEDARQVSLVAAAETLDMLTGEPTPRRLPLSAALQQVNPPARDRLGVLSAQAVLKAWEGCDEHAFALARESLAYATQVKDELQRTRMDSLIGLLTAKPAELAGRRLGERLATGQLQADVPLVALHLYTLARHVIGAGHVEHMDGSVAEALSIAQDADLSGPVRELLLAQGALALRSGDHVSAHTSFTDLLRKAEEHPLWCADALEGIALTAVRSRAYQRALKLIAVADRLRAPSPEVRTSRVWWQREVNSTRARLIDSVPGRQAEAAVTAGRALTLRKATWYALHDAVMTPATISRQAPSLSEREWQVAELVGQGLSNRQIADRLYLSIRTVDTHVRNIRTALGLKSRVQLAVWITRSVPRSSAG